LGERIVRNDEVAGSTPVSSTKFPRNHAVRVGYIQKTLPHYVQNTGTTGLKFLEMFKSNIYQDLSLSQWLTHTPPDLVLAHLGIDRATYDALPKDETVVMPA
jgi:oxalate decarboxylase